ncbi:GGDEF domain-containing protein [Kaistia adipata]|uniref:GGDEF domain-containing protein n=1 Tax=Kaistia adipata TaxID=166954 RepID=UPI0003F6982A|nr:GGDEF domain-containing protein [Kaistia adipata]
MVLDFLTLYIVILLNALTMAIIWSLIWWSYRGFGAARTWMAACLVTALGGLVLSMEGVAHVATNVAGNGFVFFGFCLYWVGVREFYGEPKPWRASFAITGGAMLVLLLFATIYPSSAARNVVYAAGQSVPLLLAVYDLTRKGRRSPGSLLAASAMGIAVLVHAVETTANLARSVAVLAPLHYDMVETIVLLLVIFSGVVWNFGMIVMAIDHLRGELAVLTYRDELTGAANRRLMQARLAAVEKRAGREGKPFSLLLIDLDNFKAINDRHGHAAGDECLRHVVATAKSCLRQRDLLARLGGDEFGALLPDTDAPTAERIAAALVAAFRAHSLVHGDVRIPLTVSIGVAASTPDRRLPIDELREAADQALYVVKRAGRDGHALAGAASPGSVARWQPVTEGLLSGRPAARTVAMGAPSDLELADVDALPDR